MVEVQARSQVKGVFWIFRSPLTTIVSEAQNRTLVLSFDIKWSLHIH